MNYIINIGSTGIEVKKIQSYLNTLDRKLIILPNLVVDGIFGSITQEAVETFQRFNNLIDDGIVGTLTWDELILEYKKMNTPLVNEDNNTPLAIGSTGLAVIKFQGYLNTILKPCVPLIEDGIFGVKTQKALSYYQNITNIKIDGLLGNESWNSIIEQNEI